MTAPDDRRLHLALLEEAAELVQRAAAEREREYGRALAQLIRAEEIAQALIADPGPLARRGEIVRDGDGEPVPDETVRRQAQKSLEQVRRDWARLTGEATG
jgi:hypothetical protein